MWADSSIQTDIHIHHRQKHVTHQVFLWYSPFQDHRICVSVAENYIIWPTFLFPIFFSPFIPQVTSNCRTNCTHCAGLKKGENQILSLIFHLLLEIHFPPPQYEMVMQTVRLFHHLASNSQLVSSQIANKLAIWKISVFGKINIYFTKTSVPSKCSVFHQR